MGGAPTLATYADDGDRLRYAIDGRTLSDDTWIALHAAEDALQTGERGPKVRVACEG